MLNILEKLVRKVERRVSPMRAVMSGSDYRKILRTPPFKEGVARVFGNDIAFSNAEGIIHSIREIFYDDVYKFHASSDDPYIVDAGANIGLSILYFKRMYPNAKIIAYEPDPEIFELLKKNIINLGYRDVDLRKAAAWVEDTNLTFYREGSLAGSTELDFLEKGDSTTVVAERLKNVLSGRKVDFLKIDIEGAETTVLFDIEDELENVEALFFEYHSVQTRDQCLGDLLSLATRAGFRYVINGTYGSARPFVERKTDGFDMQLNVSCFRP